MDLASADAEIRHVFGDTLFTEASIGAAPPDVLVKLSGLNSISSGICQQNTHFNMYARTSKPQEGFTCKDSHAKCFKTTNSTAKLYRERCIAGKF